MTIPKIFTPERCLIIAEVAQAHDGSLGTAHAFIDAIAKAGADAVKFQTHIASAESTPAEPWRVKFSQQDATRYDYWRRMEFTEEQWHGLKRHAAERNLLFLSSPFSLEAVELLKRVGVPAWKIASGEISNEPMLKTIAETGLPVLLSSGMSSWEELDQAVAKLRLHTLSFGVMQCTTAYPCPPGMIGLNLMQEMRTRYGCPVGLSDHSGTIYPGLAAVTLGAEVLELHVTLSRQMFGPDVTASVTVGELGTLVEGIRFIEKMRASPLDKDVMAAQSAPLRKLFTKSIVAAHDLTEGTILTEKHLAFKKPGTGLSPDKAGQLLGRRLLCNVAMDEMLLPDKVDGNS